jgi:hypothetical protein
MANNLGWLPREKEGGDTMEGLVYREDTWYDDEESIHHCTTYICVDKKVHVSEFYGGFTILGPCDGSCNAPVEIASDIEAIVTECIATGDFTKREVIKFVRNRQDDPDFQCEHESDLSGEASEEDIARVHAEASLGGTITLGDLLDWKRWDV